MAAGSVKKMIEVYSIWLYVYQVILNDTFTQPLDKLEIIF